MSKETKTSLKSYSAMKADGLLTPKELWTQFRIVPTLELVNQPYKNGELTLILHTPNGYKNIGQPADKDTVLVLKDEGFKFAHRNSELAQRTDVIVLDPHGEIQNLPLRKVNAIHQKTVEQKRKEGVFEKTHEEHLREERLRKIEYKEAQARIQENVQAANERIEQIKQETELWRTPAVEAALKSKAMREFSTFSDHDRYLEFMKKHPGSLKSLDDFMRHGVKQNPEANQKHEAYLNSIGNTLQSLDRMFPSSSEKTTIEGPFLVETTIATDITDPVALAIIHGPNWKEIVASNSQDHKQVTQVSPAKTLDTTEEQIKPAIVTGSESQTSLEDSPDGIDPEITAFLNSLNGKSDIAVDDDIGDEYSFDEDSIESDTKKKQTTEKPRSVEPLLPYTSETFKAHAYNPETPQVSVEITPELMQEARLAYYFKLTDENQLTLSEEGFDFEGFDNEILKLMQDEEFKHARIAELQLEAYLRTTDFNRVSFDSFKDVYYKELSEEIDCRAVTDAVLEEVFIDKVSNPVADLEDKIQIEMHNYCATNGYENFSVEAFSQYVSETVSIDGIEQSWMQDALAEALKNTGKDLIEQLTHANIMHGKSFSDLSRREKASTLSLLNGILDKDIESNGFNGVSEFRYLLLTQDHFKQNPEARIELPYDWFSKVVKSYGEKYLQHFELKNPNSELDLKQEEKPDQIRQLYYQSLLKKPSDEMTLEEMEECRDYLKELDNKAPEVTFSLDNLDDSSIEQPNANEIPDSSDEWVDAPDIFIEN